MEHKFDFSPYRKELRFLRNVTRCYAKNIIVQTFSVLLSYYYRITIVLPLHTTTRVVQV